MEITQYFRLARKWLWLLFIAAVIGGGISYISNSRRPDLYRARTTISIGNYIQQANPQYLEVRMGLELTQTYVQLISTRGVLEAVINTLNLPMSVNALEGMIDTDVPEGTSLIVLTITYTDPVFAADIANALADQIILNSPTNITAEQQSQIDFGNAQIAALSEQVASQRDTLGRYNLQLEDVSLSDNQRRTIEGLRSIAIDQINQASATIADFQQTVSAIQQRTNALTVIERASIPSSSTDRNSIANVLTGAAAGLVLALGVVIGIEYLDDRVKSTEVATQLLNLPVLGAIPRFEGRNVPYAKRLVSENASMSQAAETYRRLRTNLMFASDSTNKHKMVYVVTSAGPEEGKSVTVSNLAATMALAGLNVLLIDADLRRPKIHEIFGLQNDIGLTTLLLANQGSDSSSQDRDNLPIANLKQCLQQTTIPGLKVITAGFVPTNPAEILGSTLMKRWIDTFRAAADIDVILIDTPPVLLFADSSVFAAITDADVVLVVDADKTRRGAAFEAKKRFDQLGIEIKGVVVNRVNPREESQAYGYEYNNYYNANSSTPKERKRLGLFFRRQ